MRGNDPSRYVCHQGLGFVSGAFKEAQLHWPTVDKEG